MDRNITGIVEKGWGCEEIWANSDLYCCKFLHFKKGGQSSMHYHRKKDEKWYVLSGEFELETIDTAYAERDKEELKTKDTRNIWPGLPHRLTCKKAGVIIEVSTPDDESDHYRIEPGDSQK